MTIFSRINKITFSDDKITRRFIFFLIGLTLLASFIFKFLFLPDKYFYDSQHILDIMYNPNAITDSSYSFAANFFNFFNFFNIRSVVGWSGIILIFALFFTILFSKKFPLNGLGSNIFYFSTLFIMEIYVFTISKEFIQFIFYVVIFLICYNIKNSKFCNALLYAILAIIGIFFRKYYLILLGFLIIYDFLRIFKMKKGLRIVLFVFVLVVGLAIAKYIVPSLYNSLVNVRNMINNGGDISNMEDRATLILDVIENPDNNLFIFVLNYAVNFIRLLFPIELVIKGKILYLFFTLYQILLISCFLTLGRNDNNLSLAARKLVKISFFYICVLVIFEPDFGSFARHGCLASFLLIYPIFELEKNKLKKSINHKQKI